MCRVSFCARRLVQSVFMCRVQLDWMQYGLDAIRARHDFVKMKIARELCLAHERRCGGTAASAKEIGDEESQRIGWYEGQQIGPVGVGGFGGLHSAFTRSCANRGNTRRDHAGLSSSKSKRMLGRSCQYVAACVGR